MSKRIMLASVATVLAVGGMAFGVSSFTSRTETCPLAGTPACPKGTAVQAGLPSADKVVASAELPSCCKAKAK